MVYRYAFGGLRGRALRRQSNSAWISCVIDTGFSRQTTSGRTATDQRRSRCEDERHALPQLVGDGVDRLAFQIDVEDGTLDCSNSR
jgi:hypothetical protein